MGVVRRLLLLLALACSLAPITTRAADNPEDQVVVDKITADLKKGEKRVDVQKYLAGDRFKVTYVEKDRRIDALKEIGGNGFVSRTLVVMVYFDRSDSVQRVATRVDRTGL